MVNQTKRRALSYTLLGVWMLVIFVFSSQGHNVSHGQSEGVIQLVYSTVHVMPSEFIVRKTAHTFLYMVLGILMANVVFSYHLRPRKAILLGIIFCAMYAGSDEFHQLFVPGRGALITDVLLDTTAASVGIVLYYQLRRKIRLRHETSKVTSQNH